MVTSYGQFAYSGRIDSQSSFDNEPGVGWIVIDGTLDNGTPDCPAEGPLTDFQIVTRCSSTSNDGALNPVTIDTYYKMDWKTPQVHNLRANGVVECSSQGGGTTIQQSSSSMTGSSQDGDGDGIPNANDNCPNIPNTCYTEGDTSIFIERVLKEATHEVGHAFGLDHCPKGSCVMHFSNSLVDTDRKAMDFCNTCRNNCIRNK